ncbi:MAG: hypothetical protein ACE5HO_01235 [bacterium]
MKIGRTALEKLQNYLFEQKELGLTGQNEDYVFNHLHHGINLRVEVKDFDKYSYLIDKIELTSENEAGQQATELSALKEQANYLAENIGYLLENLAIIEIDANNARIQLRSESPRREKSTVTYFEIILDALGTLVLQRYEIDNQGAKKRSRIPFNLTEEVFENLLNDLAGSYGRV